MASNIQNTSGAEFADFIVANPKEFVLLLAHLYLMKLDTGGEIIADLGRVVRTEITFPPVLRGLSRLLRNLADAIEAPEGGE